ncbi:MAG: hypothetical protein ACOZJX_09655 [Pseudomonadota bacterium]
MTLEYRVELRGGPLLWWERALFWGCRARHAGLGVRIAAAAVA